MMSVSCVCSVYHNQRSHCLLIVLLDDDIDGVDNISGTESLDTE
jgi:hypothetical protein